MNGAHLLMSVPLLGLLVWAAMGDVRTRRIPNWLTVGLLAAGLAQGFTATPLVSPWSSLAGTAVGFALPLVLFAIGALGGGDVKLLAAVGAWVGPTGALAIFAIAALVGMILVLAQAIVQGRLNVLVRNSAVVALNVAHVRQLGVEHAQETGQSCRSVDRPLPYAVPVLIATVTVLAVVAW